MIGRGKSVVTSEKGNSLTIRSRLSGAPAWFAFPTCKNSCVTSVRTDSSITLPRISPRSPRPSTKPPPATSAGTSTGTSHEHRRRGTKEEITMKKSQRLTRRKLIKNLSLAAGASVLPDLSLTIPRFFSANRPGEILLPGKTEAAPLKLQPFPMTQVRLRAGVFQNAMEINRRYLLSLPNDRLLHTFRATASLPSSAQPLGAWEEPKCELRGHFAGGHFLSACALNYSSTGDEKLKSKGMAMVAELARCQKALKADGYLGAYPTEFYDRLRERKKVWAPFYTYHKIMAGHLDMYLHCGNEQALATAESMAIWVAKYLKPIPDEQWARMQMVEHGGMNEVLFNLYAVTGKEQYLTLARRFDHKRFFDPLAEHRDELKGLHTNTNIPKVIGAARVYELTGDQRYREIADYFWHEVTSQRTYCTGGTSNDEGWRTEPGKLASEL